MRMLPVLVLVIAATWCLPAGGQTPAVYDVVIYGPTSAGVAAAVQAKRMGRSVIVVGPDKHLGGLSSGGLGWTDSGNKAVVGGIGREFYQRVKKHYDNPAAWRWQKAGEYSRYRPDDDAQWTFEPHVAERVFEDMVRENQIEVHREQWLDREPGKGVAMKDGRIASITMLSGKVYRGRMFIDATYEGDLMAAAGVSYTVGREANARYGETLNGVQAERARSHQFEQKISPYVVPGDASSGLLPRVGADPPGAEGSGDKKIQAYNFRMCLTRVEANRVPFPKPEGYDAGQYELLLRTLLEGSRHVTGKFDPIPNAKTDTNNHGSFSTDNIAMNWDYPEAGYERRAAIIAEHRTYQQGYLWFLANDPRVPEDVRKWYSAWGLARDEFADNGHWPHQIYVREARRMVGDFVVTENHLRRKAPTPRPIGMGSYNMDSHHVQRYVTAEGFVRNEGDIQINPGGPYPIDYGAIVPRRGEAANLLVVCAVSSSHIAYGSIRMEPVFMILGQSAATAASLAIDEGIGVQDVAYENLAARLVADGQVLEYRGTASGAPADRLDTSKLPGWIIDDDKAELTGEWAESSVVGPFVGRGYRHAQGAGVASTARFTAAIDRPGVYSVRIAYSPQANRAGNVLVKIETGPGTIERRIDQRKRPTVERVFAEVATIQARQGERVAVVLTSDGASGHVIADAVWIVRVGDLPAQSD